MVKPPAEIAGPRSERPTHLATLHELLVTAAAEHSDVLISGGSCALDWGAPVAGADLLLDMSGFDDVIEYRPADMTVRVQAGMTLTGLQRVLGEHGQRLAFDPAGVTPGGANQDATIGGLIACGDSGPARLGYGSLRELVIGVTVIVPDGLVARAGGHVIKNVAGYDLGKLFHGSLGTLGVVAEAVLRVHPVPAASRTIAITGVDAAGARRLTVALLHSPYEPAAIEWLSDQSRLLVRFEGTGAGVTERCADARDLLAAHPVQGVSGIAELDDDEAARAWADHTSRVVGDEGDTIARAATPPAALPELFAELNRLARDSGIEASLVSTVGHGVHTIRLRGGDAVGHAGCLREWRTLVEARGGAVTLRRRVEGFEGFAACWGAPPSALALLRRVKHAFDPDDRFAPGRFDPWF
jgi:glycolate oxidase FAD binding subunit